jgi:hypothetical protein
MKAYNPEHFNKVCQCGNVYQDHFDIHCNPKKIKIRKNVCCTEFKWNNVHEVALGEKPMIVDQKLKEKCLEKFTEFMETDKFVELATELIVANFIKGLELEAQYNRNMTKQKKPIIKIGDTIVLAELAKLLKTDVSKLIVKIMRQGILVTSHQTIDFETATLIANQYGYGTKHVE